MPANCSTALCCLVLFTKTKRYGDIKYLNTLRSKCTGSLLMYHVYRNPWKNNLWNIFLITNSSCSAFKKLTKTLLINTKTYTFNSQMATLLSGSFANHYSYRNMFIALHRGVIASWFSVHWRIRLFSAATIQLSKWKPFDAKVGFLWMMWRNCT